MAVATSQSKRPVALYGYIGALVGLAAALAVELERRGAAQPARPSWWALPGLCALLVAAEYLFVRFRYAGEVNGLNLVEAILAPLIFFYPPATAMAAVAAAQLAGAALRRNAPVKSAFNVAQWTLAAGVGAAALSALAGRAGLTLRAVGSLLATLAVVAVVNQSAFVVVLKLANRERFRDVLRSLRPVVLPGWVAGWALNSMMGLLFVFAFAAEPGAVLLYPIPLAVLHLAYRGYAGARSDRMRLTGLHRATRILAEPIDPMSAIPSFLAEVARAFDARGAQLVLVGSDARAIHDSDFHRVPSYDCRYESNDVASLEGYLLSIATTKRISARKPGPGAQLVAAADWRDCLSAPLVSDGRVIGVLMVRDQAGLEGFEEGELAVMEALARETSSMLSKGELLSTILEERRRLDEVVETTSDGVFTIDASGAVTAWNRAIERITGITAHEMASFPDGLARLDAKDRNGVPVDFSAWERAELPSELHVKDVHGFVRRLQCSYSQARLANGAPATLVVIARDVTPDDEIRELRKQFGRLARERAAQRAVVEQLQEALMPARPVVPGVELAVSYSASDPASPTGGDLYDWQIMPSGELHVAVVDVLGHGVSATKDALAIVHALRWLTIDGCALEDLIGKVSALFDQNYPDLVATAMVARFSPATGKLRVAGGGHPPALVLSADGEVRQLPAPGGVIGWPGAGSNEIAEIELAPGESVMIYTDGLVESKRDIISGTETLMEVARELAHRPVDVFASEVVRRSLAGGDRRDDSLALVLRRTALVGDVAWEFAPMVERAHQVRQECAAWLAAHRVDADHVNDFQLVVSELVANAVHAARSRVSVHVWLDPRSIVVEVADDGTGAPELARVGGFSPPSHDVDAGRGLYIVRQLSSEVAVTSGAAGTVVRATCALDRAPADFGDRPVSAAEGDRVNAL
jgi:PAS domain S-box-containing protein